MYNNASELYNGFLVMYFEHYMAPSDAKKESWVKNTITISGLEMKNYMMQQKAVRNQLKKQKVLKNQLIYQLCHH